MDGTSQSNSEHSQWLPKSTKVLSQGWEFREYIGDTDVNANVSTNDNDAYEDEDENDECKTITSWRPVSQIPSTIHQDLINSNLLKHPFVGFNELKAEWVGEKSWIYRTTFSLSHQPLNVHQKDSIKTKVVLALDGLDTFATVRVDGTEVLQADNMFLPWRVDITHLLSHDSRCEEADTTQKMEHVLEVIFEPALIKARQIQDQYPNHKWIAWNGESSRLAVRKAQYHWGWDWGPFLMTAGIWKEVRLEIYKISIVDVRTDVRFNDTLHQATLNVRYTTEIGHSDNDNDDSIQKFCVRIAVTRANTNQESQVYHTEIENMTELKHGEVEFRIANPKLWWPNGYGDQSLYDIELSIYTADKIQLDTTVKRIGLRKLELVQNADKHGISFYFRVNNVDIFCGGSCWIPADSFLTNITPERYRSWIELMVPANQKMIRVWGGGIYENDAFYDACDELGILVWQDFMFGCGNYPAFPSMLESVKAEAIANVRRIRHHPCLAIFAGNNEDYQVQESSGLTYNYEDKNEDHWLKSDFPARYIYESLLPKVVQAECPSVAYHPGSPWGGGKISSDPTVGDIHQWNVWHGTQQKYQIFDSLGGRFNSEFGMEAFPHIDTVKSFVEHDEDLYPQSHVLDFHNKADGHERRIATYLVENVRTATDLKAYIHLTQLIQCEALMYGYRGWRKQWGDARKCGGALVWQLNDCWPVTSWSICDYYLRRKPAYYAMARTLAPIAVGIRREHHDWSVTHARQPRTQSWELWAVSSLLKDISATVEVRFISVESGEDISKPLLLHNITLLSNGSTDITKGVVDNVSDEPHVLAARIWVEGRLVGRDADWPQPLKYLRFPARVPSIKYEDNQMIVSVQRPVKCLVFEEREGVYLSDSAIDVMPGDKQIIIVRGLPEGSKPLEWTYLGAGEQ